MFARDANLQDMVGQFDQTVASAAATTRVPELDECRAEKCVHRPDLTMTAAIQLVRGTGAIKHSPSVLTRNAGESITIADRRKKPIARLVPAETNPEREALRRLASLGAITLGVGRPGRNPPMRLRRKGRLVSDMVIEDRR